MGKKSAEVFYNYAPYIDNITDYSILPAIYYITEVI